MRMMKRKGRSAMRSGVYVVVLWSAVTMAISAFGGAVYSADKVVVFPPGTALNPSSAPYSLVGGSFVVAVRSTDPADATEKVLQFRGLDGPEPATMFGTTVAGMISHVELSPDEQFVLVHSLTRAAEDAGLIVVTMLDSSGEILWTQESNRSFHFSTTGEVLSAVESVGRRYLGPVVNVHTQQGTYIKELSVDRSEDDGPYSGEQLRGLVLEGDGNSVIVATKDRVWRMTFDANPTTLWSVPRTDCEAAYIRTRVLDAERVVAERSDGGFEVLRVADGTVEYEFDPETLDESDGDEEMTRSDWASYHAYAGVTPDTATLFNQTANGYTLNFATGELAPLKIDVSVAPGQVVRERVGDQRLVILGATQGRVREIAP